jgi:hypothetical protein
MQPLAPRIRRVLGEKSSRGIVEEGEALPEPSKEINAFLFRPLLKAIPEGAERKPYVVLDGKVYCLF